MTRVFTRVRSRIVRPDIPGGRLPGHARALAILAAFLGVASLANAQQSKPEEYQVKAVYLFNFGRFVQWPAAAPSDDSFPICVIGEDPFGKVLDATVAGEVIDSHKLVARRVADPQDAVSCRILFISSSESARLKEILRALEKSTVLTVSDIPGFNSSGGMIQFVLRQNKVRFEVNLTAAEKSGLTLSSQLLKVASGVQRDPGDTGAIQ